MTEPNTTTDFDGCYRACRSGQQHTLKWGGCEHATPPEPTISMSKRVPGSDGYPTLGFDVYTVDQLAELLDPVLGSEAMRARTGSVDLAHLAAHAIVHRNDEQPPAAVFPGAPSRAAVLLEAAEQLAAMDPVEAALAGEHAWVDAANVLRRLAAEAQQSCPTACDPDCGARCHEAHQPVWKRDHQPATHGAEAQQPGVPRCPSCDHAMCDGDGPCGALLSAWQRCTCTGPGADEAQQQEPNCAHGPERHGPEAGCIECRCTSTTGHEPEAQQQPDAGAPQPAPASRASKALRVRVLREELARIEGSNGDGDSATDDVPAVQVRAVLAEILADMQPAPEPATADSEETRS